MRGLLSLVACVFAIGGSAVAQEGVRPPPADRPPIVGSSDPFADSPPALVKPEKKGPIGLRPEDTAPQYQVLWNTPGQVDRQPTELGYVRQELMSPYPIYSDGDNLLVGTARIRNYLFQTKAILPETGRKFPRQLWDLNMGFIYSRDLGGGWSALLLPSFGSPSDRPFHSIREINLGTTAALRMPAAREGDFWQFSLTYFPNFQIPYPFPGFVYEWNYSPELRVGIGVPFDLRWSPAPDWSVDVNYTPLTQITSRVNFDVTPGFRTYAGFDWINEGYFLSNRPFRRDIFYLMEKRLLGGVRFAPTKQLAIDLTGGYSFDRQFGMGRNPLNFRYDRVNASGAGFLSAWLLLFF